MIDPILIPREGGPAVLVHQDQPAVVITDPAFRLPGGTGGGVARFTHVQGTAAAEWIINHNLGVRPAVTVLGDGGGEVWAEILHLDPNQLRIYFDAPATGSALLL